MFLFHGVFTGLSTVFKTQDISLQYFGTCVPTLQVIVQCG